MMRVVYLAVSSLVAIHPGNSLVNSNSNVGSQHWHECMHVDCAIIGGGPAGLATAIALSKSSPSSSIAIFEKDTFQPKGASIQISKNGWKSLQELDDDHKLLVEKLKGTGSPVTAVEIKDWKGNAGDNGKRDRRGVRNAVKSFSLKTLTKLVSLVFRKMKKPLNVTHLWHDVRLVLRDYAELTYSSGADVSAAPADAGTSGDENLDMNLDRRKSLLSLNCNLENIHVLLAEDDDADPTAPSRENEGKGKGKERFELTFGNPNDNEGTRVRTKYLFACDGSKSRVRHLLPNEPDILLAENKSVWRGVSPNISASGKAIFYQGVGDSDTAGRSALIFPGGKNAGSSWTVISDVEDSKSLSDEEARRRVIKVIETMGTNNDGYNLLKRVIDDSPIIIENKLHVRDFDQPWESAYDGLVYVGDSAHPVRPTGEGTALAFEDANVLSQVIRRSENGLCATVLRDYENERYEPVKAVSEQIRARAESFYKKSTSKLGDNY